jgi:hypothetical protein
VLLPIANFTTVTIQTTRPFMPITTSNPWLPYFLSHIFSNWSYENSAILDKSGAATSKNAPPKGDYHMT